LRQGGELRIHLLALCCLLMARPGSASAGVVQVPRTGQTACYNESGVIVPCSGTGQDGEFQAGAELPAPRFVDNQNGTVTDLLTGLTWLKDANCTETVGGISRADEGLLDWPSALTWSNHLGHGRCGLTDSSVPGDWRLPNINELRSLVDYSRHDPALPSGNPFVDVQSAWYWSSTSNPVFTAGAFNVGMSRGSIHVTGKVGNPLTLGASRVGTKTGSLLGVWPVRGGSVAGDRGGHRGEVQGIAPTGASAP